MVGGGLQVSADCAIFRMLAGDSFTNVSVEIRSGKLQSTIGGGGQSGQSTRRCSE